MAGNVAPVEYGADGGVSAVMVSVAVPVLVNCTVALLGTPVGWLVNVTDAGLAVSPGLTPLPETANPIEPLSVATVTMPLALPALVGLNETGMDKVAPAAIAYGRVGGVTPNGAEV